LEGRRRRGSAEPRNGDVGGMEKGKIRGGVSRKQPSWIEYGTSLQTHEGQSKGREKDSHGRSCMCTRVP